MQNFFKEQVIHNLEEYEKNVERESYNKVLNILYTKKQQYDNILHSTEGKNIFEMSKGERFQEIYERRQVLWTKVALVTSIIEQVCELWYGKF